jgi:hypothetical protein
VLDNHTVSWEHKAFILLAGLLEEERREYFSIQFPESLI